MNVDKEDQYNYIIASKFAMIKRYRYLAVLLSKLVFQLSEGIQTACTDGKRNVYFDPELVDKLEEGEMKGVILHEVLHIFLMHTMRQKDFRGRELNQFLWNMAADYVVNLIIQGESGFSYKNKIKLMEGSLLDHKYIGWSTEEVYADLLEINEERKNKGEDGDEGRKWKFPVSTIRGGDIKREEMDIEEIKRKIGHEWEEMSGEEKSRVKDSIAQGIQKGTPAGSGKGPLRDVLRDLSLEAKRDWRDVMEHFVFDSKSLELGNEFKYEERLLGNDIYFIEDEYEDCPSNILFGVDVSGSVVDEQLREFLENVVDCIEQFDITEEDDSDVIFFHSDIEKVVSVEYIRERLNENKPIVDDIKTGGTDLKIPFEYCREHGKYNGVIVMTDCMGEFIKEFELPTLVVTDNKCANNIPEFADVVYIDPRE